ncbi:MAG: Hsp70 family protein [Spirochaetes bacterium]|nr:Hsp70 family protein [Spirochaetota bacterium]
MKKIHVSIDLGTTNTVAAVWNDKYDSPEILRLENVSRGLDKSKKKEIDDSYTIPTCVYLRYPEESLKFPFNFIFKKVRTKTDGFIGLKALNEDSGTFNPRFINSFKSYLGKNNYQFIGELGKWKFNADDIAYIFLKNLLIEIKKSTGTKVSDMTICAPVDFYEFYRLKLKKIAQKLNIRTIKTIDEPVAAALGYGLYIDQPKNILIIDFGGGTLDFALIEMEEKTSLKGKCTVIAKDGAPIGGNLIDSWIVEELCSRFNYNFNRFSNDPGIKWWFRMLLKEACRVKEALFTKTSETFYLMPSQLMKQYAFSMIQDHERLKKPINFSKSDLISLLEKKGLYSVVDKLISNVLFNAEKKGITEDKIHEVVMVGGSTLLPNIYHIIEKRFGRHRVKAWQPFNAIAFGAAVFSADRFNKIDHITHDYAFLTYDKKTFKPVYTIIIPKGTTFPTQKDFWKRQLLPTCAHGEPETIFKLIIYEIGRKHTVEQEFIWDEKGNLHIIGEGRENKKLIIPLNESDPTMGYLKPSHYPSDKKPRIEISFMVNEDKWLCATVYDIFNQKHLIIEKPVVCLK